MKGEGSAGAGGSFEDHHAALQSQNDVHSQQNNPADQSALYEVQNEYYPPQRNEEILQQLPPTSSTKSKTKPNSRLRNQGMPVAKKNLSSVPITTP